jgi:hypothetical protein
VSNAQHVVPPSVAGGTGRPVGEASAIGGDGGDIEQLHKLLVDASAGMLRRAEEAERQVAELQLELTDLERAVGGALRALAGESRPVRGPQSDADLAAAAERRLSELAQLARTAAEHPRHLDHISALAERASDISGALEASADLARALGTAAAHVSAVHAEPAGDAD